jgi:hypothetical protein
MHGSFDLSQFGDWVTEGYDDVAIDLLPTRSLDGELTISIVQCKYGDAMSSTEIAALHTSLTYVFEARATTLAQLTNEALAQRIKEVRELLRSATSVRVDVVYVTRGRTKNASSQVQREISNLKEHWGRKPGFADVSVRLIGPQELVAAAISNTYRVPDRRLTLPYVGGTAATLEYVAQRGSTNTMAVVSTVAASDLASIVRGNETWLFRENVRDFLGETNRVNRSIAATAKSATDAGLFWLLNNGVTITCSQMSYGHDPDAPSISLFRPQIVNGCQTSEVLAQAHADGTLRDEARLVIKIVETDDEALIDDITLATNSQTQVKKSDLHSNDFAQRTLALAFDSMGLIYQTKPGQLRIATKQRATIVRNEKCGQASLAVFCKAPAIAMSRKSAIWEDAEPSYRAIFGRPAMEMLYAYRIVEFVERRRKEAGATLRPNSERVSDYVIRYGVFHVARVMSFLLLHDPAPGTTAESTLEKYIADAESDARSIRLIYDQARKRLARIIRDFRRTHRLTIVSCFKSQAINEWITRDLHGG